MPVPQVAIIGRPNVGKSSLSMAAAAAAFRHRRRFRGASPAIGDHAVEDRRSVIF